MPLKVLLSVLPKSLRKKNVIEAFDRSYLYSNLMTKVAKPTNLARWAILATLLKKLSRNDRSLSVRFYQNGTVMPTISHRSQIRIFNALVPILTNSAADRSQIVQSQS